MRGSSVKDPTPKHDKRSTSPMPKMLTPATFFSFPLNAPEGPRATHTFCPLYYILSHTITYYDILSHTYTLYMFSHTFTHFHILSHPSTYYCILLHTIGYHYIPLHTNTDHYIHTIYIHLHTFTYNLHTFTYMYILLHTSVYSARHILRTLFFPKSEPPTLRTWVLRHPLEQKINALKSPT